MRHWSRFSAEVTCFIKLNCDKMAIEKVQLTYPDSVVARVVTLHSANRVMSQESAIDKGTYLTGLPEKWRERMIPSC